MSGSTQQCTADDQRAATRAALRRTGLTLEQVWLRYFALGGEAGFEELDGYLHGALSLPPLQTDLFAHAVNERLDELSGRRVPYRRPVREALPATGPLAALVAASEGVRCAPPERLGAVAAAAARSLGVEASVYLVDYEQRDLVPVLGADRTEVVPIDSTLAGQAYRRVEILPAEAPEPRLWVPLVDGVERLGVVGIAVGTVDDLYDPALRQQCSWLAGLLGHLVVSVGHYGDGLDAVRRRRPRSTGSELVWQLLPPLTGGTGSVTVSGIVEPAYDVGGDAFDYALGETTAHLAVFDAVGHSLRSGIAIAATLAAYRSSRRNGHGLFEQAEVVDRALEEALPPAERLVTGVLAELDLESGRLRYVVAGHPEPLVLRGGRVVRSLGGAARRPLFGLPAAVRDRLSSATPVIVGEETLEPGDWLVLHTDGVTEARDARGEFFGETRLTDFLRRQLADGHPPPETVRRLMAAVLAHQGGALQDDATILLARWEGRGERT